MDEKKWGRLDLLGGFRIERDGSEIETKGLEKQTLVLLALLAKENKTWEREALCETLWHSDSRKNVTMTTKMKWLSRHLSLSRTVFGRSGSETEGILTTRHTVHLNRRWIRVDVEDFDKAYADAMAETDISMQADLFALAVRLYKGELVPGFDPEIFDADRERLAFEHGEALYHLALTYAKAMHSDAIPLASKAAAIDPLHTQSHVLLAHLFYDRNEPEKAYSQINRIATLLHNEGEDVPENVMSLLSRLEEGEAITWPYDRYEDVQLPSVWDIVESHEGMAQPTHSGIKTQRRILPPLTRFFGRNEELEELGTHRLLFFWGSQAQERSAVQQVITLWGPGGSGKTRLALEVAQSVASEAGGGSWFVRIGETATPDSVIVQIAHEMTLHLNPKRSVLDQIREVLSRSTTPMLLILDGFDYLVKEGETLVHELVASNKSLICLLTSRRRLGFGESYPVKPLVMPEKGADTEQIKANPCVQLFVDRARARHEDFRLDDQNASFIAQICRALDGLPLAIEMAASRIEAKPLTEMVAELSERLQWLEDTSENIELRHQSLRATFAWSFAFLPLETQVFFARLSVFACFWDIEAATSVCGHEKASEAFAHILQLTKNSFAATTVWNNRTTYRMLDTMREYAAEKLVEQATETEQRELARRHALYFCGFAQRAAESYGRAGQNDWFDRIEEHHDNLRAALKWCLKSPEEDALGLALTAALAIFWLRRGYVTEGRHWLHTFLSRNESAAPTAARGLSYIHVAMMAQSQGGTSVAEWALDKGEKDCRIVEDNEGIARVYLIRGINSYELSNFEDACAAYETALRFSQEGNNEPLTAQILNNWGNALAEIPERRHEAQGYFDKSLSLRERLGDEAGIVEIKNNVANSAFNKGEYEQARLYWEECLATQEHIGLPRDKAISLNNLGCVAHVTHGYDQARRYHERALSIRRELHHLWGIASSLFNLGGVDYCEGKYQAAQRNYRESLRISHDREDPIEMALCINQLAHIAVAQQEYRQAAWLWGVAGGLDSLQKIINQATQEEKEDFQAKYAAMTNQLGEQAWEIESRGRAAAQSDREHTVSEILSMPLQSEFVSHNANI